MPHLSQERRVTDFEGSSSSHIPPYVLLGVLLPCPIEPDGAVTPSLLPADGLWVLR
jgi:hypothetical protein